MKYRVHFPLTFMVSACSDIVRETRHETKEELALWHYNRRREHDGLPPIKRLPEGTRFELIAE